MTKHRALMTSVATAPLVLASGPSYPRIINFTRLAEKLAKAPSASDQRPALVILEATPAPGPLYPLSALAGFPPSAASPFRHLSRGQLARVQLLRWDPAWCHVQLEDVIKRVLGGDFALMDVAVPPPFIIGITPGCQPQHARAPTPEEVEAIPDLEERARVLCCNPHLDLTEGPYRRGAEEIVASMVADEAPSFPQWNIENRLEHKPGVPAARVRGPRQRPAEKRPEQHWANLFADVDDEASPPPGRPPEPQPSLEPPPVEPLPVDVKPAEPVVDLPSDNPLPLDPPPVDPKPAGPSEDPPSSDDAQVTASEEPGDA